MELIVDANILFAALITKSATASLLLRSDITLFAPEYIFDEYKKYESEILRKTKRTKADFTHLVRILKSKIHLIAKDEVLTFIDGAKEICPDENDYPYFACALSKKCPIWSNDKALKNQDTIYVINTTELLLYLTSL